MNITSSQRGPGRNKKKWTATEDKVLVESMVDMVNMGKYKADNSFKPGYLAHLEAVMEDRLPGCNIKAKPYIESRLKILKMVWSIIHDMVSGRDTSGFGWNTEEKVLTTKEPVWEAYLKVHKAAAQWKDKRFEHYENLCIVFGKDRATGKDTQTPADVVDELDRLETFESEYFPEMSGIGNLFDGMNVEFDTSSPTTQSNPMSVDEDDNSSRSSKKRRRSQDPLVLSITNAAKELGSHIVEASNKLMRFESEITDLQKNLMNDLTPITTLTQIEKMRAARKLLANPSELVFFSTLELAEKEAFLQDLFHNDV